VHAGGKPLHFGQPVGAEIAGTPSFGPTAPATGWDQWLLVKLGEKSRQHLYGESFVTDAAQPIASFSYSGSKANRPRDSTAHSFVGGWGTAPPVLSNGMRSRRRPLVRESCRRLKIAFAEPWRHVADWGRAVAGQSPSRCLSPAQVLLKDVISASTSFWSGPLHLALTRGPVP
jgi:hypothetical protein